MSRYSEFWRLTRHQKTARVSEGNWRGRHFISKSPAKEHDQAVFIIIKIKSRWKVRTRIDIIKDFVKDYYWCFATNLRQSLYLISKYKQRWQIETDFRVHDEARIKSKSNEFIVRYFYFLTSLILLANWEVNRLLYPTICFKKYLKQVQEEFEKEEVT